MLYPSAKLYALQSRLQGVVLCLAPGVPDWSIAFGAVSCVPIFSTAGLHHLAFPMSTAWAAASELVTHGCLHHWEWRMRAFVGYDLSDVV